MTAQIIVLSDHRAAKARQATGSSAVVACETMMNAGFLTAFAWITACEDAAELFMVPWPGGIDDLKF